MKLPKQSYICEGHKQAENLQARPPTRSRFPALSAIGESARVIPPSLVEAYLLGVKRHPPQTVLSFYGLLSRVKCDGFPQSLNHFRPYQVLISKSIDICSKQLFGPQADKLAADPALQRAAGPNYTLVGVPSEGAWGRSSTALVELMEQDRLIGIVSTDRNSSHLAEQLAAKMFVPLIALSADRSLTALNIPWIFRMPPDVSIKQAVRTMAAATQKAGANRGRVRELLASGATLAGAVQFNSRGEMR